MRIIILLFLSVKAFGATDTLPNITIPFEYSISTEKPLIFTRGQAVFVDSDSIFAYNAPRHRLFTEVVKSFLDGDFSDDYLLDLYAKSEAYNNQIFDRLQNNHLNQQRVLNEQTEAISDIAKQRSKNLNALQYKANQALAEATELKRIAKVELRKAKRKKVWSFIKGFGIGALTGGVGILILN